MGFHVSLGEGMSLLCKVPKPLVRKVCFGLRESLRFDLEWLRLGLGVLRCLILGLQLGRSDFLGTGG